MIETPSPRRLKGIIVDSGGGEVRLVVNRDTSHYPPTGVEVVLRW